MIKRIAPTYYRYLRIQRKKGISIKGIIGVSVVSFTFSLLNAGLTSLVVNGSSYLALFSVGIMYYTALLFSVKVMAFSKTIGKILLVLFSSLGFVVGVYLFQ